MKEAFDLEKWNRYSLQRAEQEGGFFEVTDVVGKSMPSVEYASGEKKLAYAHSFSTGHSLEIKEDNSGLVSMYLRRPSGAKIDLQRKNGFVSGVKLTTPTYAKLNNIRNGYSENGYWYAEEGRISVGDMKTPESLFILLHELGHLEPRLKERLSERDIYIPGPTMDEALLQSFNERAAWANALKIVRFLRKKYDVNMMEIFPSVENFHKFMASALKVHRYKHEFDIKEVRQELLNDSSITELLSDLFDKHGKPGTIQGNFGLKKVA